MQVLWHRIFYTHVTKNPIVSVNLMECGVLLGTEGPSMMPNSVDFFVFPQDLMVVDTPS